jgi:hypothetical protein
VSDTTPKRPRGRPAKDPAGVPMRKAWTKLTDDERDALVRDYGSVYAGLRALVEARRVRTVRANPAPHRSPIPTGELT